MSLQIIAGLLPNLFPTHLPETQGEMIVFFYFSIQERILVQKDKLLVLWVINITSFPAWDSFK
jgi:hypothetical protein